MKERQEEILQLLTENQQGLTASDVAERLTIDRSNASRYLSELYKAHHIVKTAWPTSRLLFANGKVKI